jgi:hypothetical protein
MDLGGIGFEDGRWMEVSQDRGQWRRSFLSVLMFQILLHQGFSYCFLSGDFGISE